ncbi:MAG: AMP-binding protein [Solirubrobacteraceae bacterium]
MLKPTAPPMPPALVAGYEAAGLRTRQQIGWVLEHAAARRPGDVAVIAGGRRHTFGELRDHADAISWQLLDAGLGRGDIVCWTLPNDVAAIALAMAIWRIGAVSNPVVPIYREREFAFILGQLRPQALVGAVDVRGRAQCEELDRALALAGHEPALRLAFGAGAPAGWTPLATAADERPLPAEAQPAAAEAPALVLYTSGTTADPKGVIHSGAALLHEAGSMQREWGLTYRETMVMASPLPHITGVLQGLLVPCLTGARVLLLDRWDAEACVEVIERDGGTYMAGATPFLQGVVDVYAARGGRPGLRQFCCGGAPVPPALIEAAEAVGIVAHRSWGMTEFPSATFSHTTDPLEQRAHTDGRPGEGIEVQAVDDAHRPLPAGEQGELRIRGPERMDGYVDAALNADVLDEEGWVYSGDVGLIDGAGCVRVTGRLKDIVNRGGEKLSAREIEELLLQHESVLDAAVVPWPDERLGEVVAAAVVLRPGHRLDTPAILRFLRAQHLASQKTPATIGALPELPRTPSGKVRKHVVLQLLRERGA